MGRVNKVLILSMVYCLLTLSGQSQTPVFLQNCDLLTEHRISAAGVTELITE